MMRRGLLLVAALTALMSLASCGAGRGTLLGPSGRIAYRITLPEGFDTATGRCPMVILMHGIFSSQEVPPIPQLAKGLARAGIASIRFDFDGHGRSDGRVRDMTIEKEIADAMAVWDHVQGLSYVQSVGVLGHSQGGVVASMVAGRLATWGGAAPAALVLLAPGAVIKEACQSGKFFEARFDPADPPEYVRCWGIYKLGREYLLTTQQLDIYGTAAAYTGPVLLVHGSRDGIVPMWCSRKYLDTYGSAATLQVVEGENHTFSRHTQTTVDSAVDFFRRALVH